MLECRHDSGESRSVPPLVLRGPPITARRDPPSNMLRVAFENYWCDTKTEGGKEKRGKRKKGRERKGKEGKYLKPSCCKYF